MAKCEYCLKDGEHRENCPDKLSAGPERDLAMVGWGAGAIVASMGGTVFGNWGDNIYFMLGYHAGSILLKEEDLHYVFNRVGRYDAGFDETDFDDWGDSDRR